MRLCEYLYRHSHTETLAYMHVHARTSTEVCVCQPDCGYCSFCGKSRSWCWCCCCCWNLNWYKDWDWAWAWAHAWPVRSCVTTLESRRRCFSSTCPATAPRKLALCVCSCVQADNNVALANALILMHFRLATHVGLLKVPITALPHKTIG